MIYAASYKPQKEVHMFDRIVLICLAVFLLLFGLFAVTNVQIDSGKAIMGGAALVAGVALVIKAFR
jgi:uncharacterized membrane protein HdeD (DUF308 family)